MDINLDDPVVQLPEIATYIALGLVALIFVGVLLPRLNRLVFRNRGVLRAIPAVLLVVGAAVAGVLARH